jgi:SAM-dependent methyltransferase
MTDLAITGPVTGPVADTAGADPVFDRHAGVPQDYRIRACPVCAAPYMVFVTTLKTLRTGRDLPIYGCLSCRSFSNPSGYVETESVLRADLEWHKGVAERNAAASAELLTRLAGMGVDCSRILEIGSGIGTFLKTAAATGATGIGYDVNPLTQPYARDVNGIDVRAEFWTADTDCGPFSLLVCISVLEHVPAPRALIADMVKACLAQGAALYISVPFVDAADWPHLHAPTPGVPGTPFFDQDVHVTHFSSAGLEQVLRDCGMGRVEKLRSRLWIGMLARA